MSDTNETAGVSTGVRLHRFIPMEFFRHLGTGPNGRPKSLPFEVMKARDETPEGQPVPPIKCGVVIGRCVGYKTQEKVDAKDGTIRKQTALLGNFEASRFSDGSSMEAGSIYLPPLFTEQAVAQLDGGAKAIDFCIEVGAEPNPAPNAAVVYTWTFHDMMPRAIETSPLARLKAMVKHPLIKHEVAALPAPQEPEGGPTPEGVGDQPASDVGEVAAAEDAKTRAGGKGRKAA